MGWKLNMIITTGLKGDTDVLSRLLGFSYGNRTFKSIGETTLNECMNPDDDDKIYIGIFKDFRIITQSKLPIEFMTEKPNFTEKSLSPFYRQNCSTNVFVLDSVINLWGYNILSNGERIRTKFGTHDNGVIYEEGDPLNAELELLNKSEIMDGKRVFHFSNDIYNEDQIGEEFVFRLIENITSERLDNSGSILDTKMTIYETIEKKGYEEIRQRILANKEDK